MPATPTAGSQTWTATVCMALSVGAPHGRDFLPEDSQGFIEGCGRSIAGMARSYGVRSRAWR